MNFLDEDSDEESKSYQLFGGREGTILLIDASEPMFSSSHSHSQFTLAITCAQTMMKNVAIRSSSDEMAVILYGTDLTSNAHTFQHIFVVQPLNKVNADIINDLQTFKDCDFSADYGHSDQYSLSDAFWTSLLMFNKSKSKFEAKNIILFTCNDEPHCGNSVESKQKRKRAVKLASDLKDNGITVKLIPLASNKPFNFDRFYMHLFPHLNDEKIYTCDKLSDLMSRVYSKSYKQRMLASVSFRLGRCDNISTEFADLSMSVYVYSLFLEARKPTPVRMNRKNCEEIVTETQRWTKDTGAVVSLDNTSKRFEYGRENIYMTQNVIKEIKSDFDSPGITLLGFKSRSAIKTHLHLKPGHFIYPDETSVKGSTCLFNSLLNRCAERDVVAICRFVMRSSASPRLIALYPQIEIKSLSKPGGFHVIYLPFQEDIREVPLKGAEVMKVEDKAVDKAKDIIKKLHFNYDPNNFPNPVLQTHWRAIEALALNLDNVDKFDDSATQPNYSEIDRNAGHYLKEFNQLCGGPAMASNLSEKKLEIPDNLEKLTTDGQLGTLTVNVLREFCKSKGIKACGTKKAEYIEAIQSYYSK